MKNSIADHKLNFGSGPAALPAEVLQEASGAVIDYNGSGLSILEIPHRGKLFHGILEESNHLVKQLCSLGDDYEVLWLQGGGRLQFCMIPMNFLGEREKAGYIDSGHWASEAAAAASFYGNTAVMASSKECFYNELPEWPSNIPSDLSYLHFTTNNTIYGTQWPDIPDTSVPLIADMSSDILSRERNYRNCAMFYAVAQKNIGPAGVTLVVLHREMLKQIKRSLPPMLDYKAHAAQNSLLNTPPVFAIYTSMLTLRWTAKQGMASLEAESIKKADLLYGEIDRNNLFHTTVLKQHRSRMNVVFKTKDVSIEKSFSDFCAQNSITGIEGHRSVGGFRVSLYNAVPLSAVQQLVDRMQEFENIIEKQEQNKSQLI